MLSMKISRVIIDYVDVLSQSVGDYHFLKKAPDNMLDAIEYTLVIQFLFLVKLVQHVLRALNRSCDQLREIHDI